MFGFQKTFHGTDVLCTPSRLFVRLGFRLLCARLAVHYFTVHSVLRSLEISKQQGKECNGCLRVRYNYLFSYLPFFTK